MNVRVREGYLVGRVSARHLGILQQRSLEGVTMALLFIVDLVAVESNALVGPQCQPRHGTCGQQSHSPWVTREQTTPRNARSLQAQLPIGSPNGRTPRACCSGGSAVVAPSVADKSSPQSICDKLIGLVFARLGNSPKSMSKWTEDATVLKVRPPRLAVQ